MKDNVGEKQCDEERLNKNAPNTPLLDLYSSESLPNRLSVSSEVHGVVSLPCATSGRTLDLVEAGPLAVATVLGASGSEASEFTVLHHWGDDPVDTGVTTDGLVLWVNQDDFEVLVRRVLADPVRVEHTEGAALSSCTFFSL